ncbi:hypothetical protein ACW5R3_10060 [Bizionia sp. KMM 8389]
MKLNWFKQLLAVVITILLSNCSNSPEASLKHIEGYWEIETATLKDGTSKSYNYNDTIDFISLNDSLSGFRKKMKPNFTGNFQTSNDTEFFQIKIENDSINVYYKTAFDNWKETILFATKTQLKVVNKNDDVFLYKRYQPLNLD